MNMQEFIDDHRGELDTLIRGVLNRPNQALDDEEREEWINNDEGLYLWAQDKGVFDEEEEE